MKKILLPILCLLWFPLAFALQESRQGIYINEGTMNNADYLQSLITRGKAVGINTFIIDYQYGGQRYQQNIKLVLQNGIKYVARIVVFPNGGTDAQVLSHAYWEKKYRLVQRAIALGASEIQLDYIRYDTTQRPSPRNAQNIYNVIKWFKNKLKPQGIPLEIDVFGVSSFGDSIYIGQSLTLFADSVDAVCPMVYPSHYEPYLKYAKEPYEAVFSSLTALRHQFLGNIPFNVYPFIETYNYRYPLSNPARVEYILRQLQAVDDSRVEGYYVWNPSNNYNNLFIALKNRSHSS
ncbi:MAG: putative glycoside hydrolase [Gammaproteobacteria bacterium]|nr:putative glycoside hydrolase [Gammaproteobacteria bacterium]